MQIKFVLILGMTFICTQSCIKPFFPELEEESQLLVVDGNIHSGEGPYTVRLNISSPIFARDYPPVEGATLVIRDDQGTFTSLEEVEPGIYQTSDPSFQGMPGRAYQLSIQNALGKSYESSFEVLPASSGIDSIHARVEYRQQLEGIPNLPGYQFYLDGKAATSEKQYYLFELERTYKYHAMYAAVWEYAGFFREFPDPLRFFTCYSTLRLDDIFLYSTEGLSDPNIRNFPLHFEGTTGKTLTVRYSLKVRQYSLNANAYRYWEQVKNINENNGSLFTQQPYQLRGNITPTEGEAEVLGYFFAAGLSEKRIFVDRPANVPFYDSPCILITENLAMQLQTYEWPVYLTETSDDQRALSPGGCIDCRELGGTIERPVFWED